MEEEEIYPNFFSSHGGGRAVIGREGLVAPPSTESLSQDGCAPWYVLLTGPTLLPPKGATFQRPSSGSPANFQRLWAPLSAK